MDWSKRTVKNSFNVEKYTIEDLMGLFVDNVLFVNRRYQRKLVWGLRDKQCLIDSLIKEIPLPALLFSVYDIPDEIEDVHEIVDGVQRIHTMLSFLLGEFGIECNGKLCYFNPKYCSYTFDLMQDEDPRLVHRDEYLDKVTCKKIAKTPLAVIETGQDDELVNLIFSRLNSTGKKISSQDLRQSFATGEFADLVRRIASDIRLDNTYSDHICLADIKQISVGDKKYGYGVDLNNTFWRKHDILIKSAIIESGDEELIETLLASKLIPNFKKNKTSLDRLYQEGTKEFENIEQQVVTVGKDVIENSFKQVFDNIDMIFDSVNSNFSDYLFEVKKTRNKDKCFGVLFLALERLFSENYFIDDYASIADKLKNSSAVFDKIVKTDSTSYVLHENDITAVYDSLKPLCCLRIDSRKSEMEVEIEKRLCYSKTECQLTEFKIGLSDFNSKDFNMDLFARVSRTLVAMANISEPREEGLLIVGIADSVESYHDWRSVYNVACDVCNQHCITGIDQEAKKLSGNVDRYSREVRKMLESQPISKGLKEYVFEHFGVVDFHGKSLLVFRVKSMPGSLYNGMRYTRKGSETIKVND